MLSVTIYRPILSVLCRNVKKWTFLKIDPGRASILSTSATPPPPMNFAEFGAPGCSYAIPLDNGTWDEQELVIKFLGSHVRALYVYWTSFALILFGLVDLVISVAASISTDSLFQQWPAQLIQQWAHICSLSACSCCRQIEMPSSVQLPVCGCCPR